MSATSSSIRELSLHEVRQYDSLTTVLLPSNGDSSKNSIVLNLSKSLHRWSSKWNFGVNNPVGEVSLCASTTWVLMIAIAYRRGASSELLQSVSESLTKFLANIRIENMYICKCRTCTISSYNVDKCSDKWKHHIKRPIFLFQHPRESSGDGYSVKLYRWRFPFKVSHVTT